MRVIQTDIFNNISDIVYINSYSSINQYYLLYIRREIKI